MCKCLVYIYPYRRILGVFYGDEDIYMSALYSVADYFTGSLFKERNIPRETHTDIKKSMIDCF